MGGARVNGTNYSIKAGKTKINGTNYTIPFTPDPIYIINDGSLDYTWTHTGTTQTQGYIQWGSSSYYALKFHDEQGSAGMTRTVQCQTSFNLTGAKQIKLRYAFHDGTGMTNSCTFQVGSWSTNLSQTNWSYTTYNVSGLGSSCIVSFSWRPNGNSDHVYLDLNEIQIVF